LLLIDIEIEERGLGCDLTLSPEFVILSYKVTFKRGLFKGEIRLKDGRPKGLHYELSAPSRLAAHLALPPDNFGVYAGYYQEGNWLKYSSFFPQKWSHHQVKNKIIEAFKNPQYKEPAAVVGKTSEGLLIKVAFKRDYQKNCIALTAYPLYKNDNNVSKFMQMLGHNSIAVCTKP
jgi:hypothetical protein